VPESSARKSFISAQPHGEIMMDAAQIISTIEALGIRLRLVDGRVRMSGNREAMVALAPELRAAFRDNLAACAAHLGDRLREPPADMDAGAGPARLALHARELWQQIMEGEHDAGFTNCTHRVVEVRGPVDLARLRAAADDLVASHPILGCKLHGAERDWLVETPQESGAVFVTRAMPGNDAEELRALVHDLVWKPLRGDGDLHRIFAVSNDSDRHVIGVVLHHFVADQPSIAIAWNVLAQRYHAHSVGLARKRPKSERLAIARLTDPRDIHSDPAFARERNFWGRQTTLIKDSMIVDSTIAATSASAAFQVVRPVVVNSSSIPALVRLGRDLRTGMLPILLAAQALALWRRIRSPELGTLLLERGRHAAPESEAIGNFARLVPLATRVEPGDNLARVAARIHSERLAALAMRTFPYEGIAKVRWPAGAPVLPLFNYLQAPPTPALPPDGGSGPVQVVPFVSGPAPLVPCRAREFEAHYLHFHFDGAELTGFLRYSPRKVTAEVAGAFVKDIVEILESTGAASR
jgi:hypothetical protein